MPDDLQFWWRRRGRAIALILLMALTTIVCGSSFAQSKDAAGRNGSGPDEAASALVGKFGDDKLSIIIERHEGKFRGTISRSGVPFLFTGDLKGASLNGLIDVDGSQTGFAATITGDELTLKLGLDSHKLLRVETGGWVGKFSRGEWAIDIERHEGKYRGIITRGGKPFVFTGEGKGSSLSGLVKVEGSETSFTATLARDEVTLKLGLDSLKLDREKAKPPQPKPPVAQKGKATYKEVLLARSEDVQFGSEIASPDNRRIGFIIQRDGFRIAAIDGVEGKPYRRAGSITFSADSRRWLHVGERADGKLLVIVDGVESQPYDDLGQDLTKFSADGKRFAFAAMHNKQWRAVIDGKESEPHDEIRFITFSPDGQRVAFAGRRARSWRVVIDGVEGDPYDDVGREGIVFSPDSKRAAFTAIKSLNQHTIVDGVMGKAYEGIAGFAFSRDSLHTHFVALREGQYVVVYDGQEKGTYQTVYGLSFSADGKHIVLGVRNEGKSFQVIDDRPGPEFDMISPPLFSPDNRQMVYAARRNAKWSVIRDGRFGEPHDQVSFMAFGPDSRRLAYVAIDGESAKVVIDGESSATYDRIWRNGLYFSPDSKHLVFGGERKGEAFLVVDGAQSEAIGTFIPGSQPVFDGSDQFHIVTRRGPTFSRTDARIVEAGR